MAQLSSEGVTKKGQKVKEKLQAHHNNYNGNV